MSKLIKTLGLGFSLASLPLMLLTSINSSFAAETTLVGQERAQVAEADNRYVVTFKNSASLMSEGKFSPAAAIDLMQTYNATTLHSLDIIRGLAIKIAPLQLAKLLKNEQVEHIEVDQRRYLLAAPHLLAETSSYGLAMVQADQLSDAAAGNQKICIVDSGYDINHEDLRSSGITGNDNDGNGGDTGNWYHDGHGHGSHVAGIISAIGGNNLGVVGVNPSATVGLHIVKVFNDDANWAYGSDLIAAITQCQNAGASVISMSLGGAGSMTSESTAFSSALNNGVLSVAAAGDGGSSLSYPASYGAVISVAAVDSDENIHENAQNNSLIEIAAPGVEIESTIPGGYASWSGTSMATAYVSGVAALAWSHHPQCSADQIRYVLNATAKDKGSAGRDNYYGHGIVQAKAAVDAISNTNCSLIIDPLPIPPFDNLSANRGEWLYYSAYLPQGISNFTVTISGGSGDADLYVKQGSKPTSGWQGSYDCRPYLGGNEEVCTFTNPGEGTWHIGLKAYSSFSGVTLDWHL